MVGDKVKNLIVVSVTSFPNGLASSNRLSTLLMHLPDNGWQVNVICVASTKYPTEMVNDKPTFKRKGTISNVSFQYSSLTVKAHSLKVIRILSGIYGWFALIPIILKLKSRFGTRIIMTNLTQIHYILFLKIINMLLGYKFVLLRSEYPSVIRKPCKKTNIYKKYFEKWIFKNFDGFALMTNSLKEYFADKKSSKASIGIIPMTVDLGRFKEIGVSPFNFEYIAYAGSLSSEKDGVDILIKAFIRIADLYNDLKLVIIGDKAESQNFNNLIELTKQAPVGVANRIIFTGRIDASKIPSYIGNAKIVALARPDSIQAVGGFPTKLGEYLATAKPVVVSSVGEIPLYLEHKKNAIFAKPGSIQDFAKQMDWILNNLEEANLIGLGGRKVAEEVFNSIVQSKNLSTFLENL
jgi:glycosyltransferase involved in cell wall biosynthesis